MGWEDREEAAAQACTEAGEDHQKEREQNTLGSCSKSRQSQERRPEQL